MLQDGTYYEGMYSNHRRHGQGVCYYQNGEFYEGEWSADKRVHKRGKMKFLNGIKYTGGFIGDQADGTCMIEDAANNLFQVEIDATVGKDGKENKNDGCIMNARLQKTCSVQFVNGDKFFGTFKDGRPNGYGEMYYKNSLTSTTNGIEFEIAQYKGNFRLGRREGKGKMVWADGSSFEGTWLNDMRHEGKMIMNNNCVYIGKFQDDKFHDKMAKLLIPTNIIYEGEFILNKTAPIGMLLYPNGGIYYGQQSQFSK